MIEQLKGKKKNKKTPNRKTTTYVIKMVITRVPGIK